MSFVTQCNACRGNLNVTNGTFAASGARLCEDGFNLFQAKQLDTSDEVATCTECGHLQDLFGNDVDTKIRPFTVVGCHGSCSNGSIFVDHVDAGNHKVAKLKSLEARDIGATVISVFEGHHYDLNVCS